IESGITRPIDFPHAAGADAADDLVRAEAGSRDQSQMRAADYISGTSTGTPKRGLMSEQIIKDPERDATYNSGAPGTKYPRRLHYGNAVLFVVIGKFENTGEFHAVWSFHPAGHVRVAEHQHGQ